jgi:hypothetical protein
MITSGPAVPARWAPSKIKLIWGWVKTLVPLVNPKIAGIYGCSSH